MSFNLSSVLAALKSASVSPTLIPNVLSTLAGGIGSKTTAQLTQLQSLANNPAAFAEASPQLISQVESTSGLPATVLPLLEELRHATDPLQISELISSIETTISAQTSVL